MKRKPIALCLLLALAGCKPKLTAVNGLTPITLQTDWYPQPEHGGFFAAQMLGYYKAEGLDVTLLPLPQYVGICRSRRETPSILTFAWAVSEPYQWPLV